MLGLWSVAAWAYQPPNSTLGVSVGTPWTIGGRGEAWLADEVSGELGGGTGLNGGPVGFDVSLRFRPDVLCLLCGRRALVTFGVGVSGIVEPDLQFDGPWSWAVGPDVAATFVYWFSTGYGFEVGAHGGAGPRFQGSDLEHWKIQPWGFGTVGFAF